MPRQLLQPRLTPGVGPSTGSSRFPRTQTALTAGRDIRIAGKRRFTHRENKPSAASFDGKHI
jgi:hypothetical protein